MRSLRLRRRRRPRVDDLAARAKRHGLVYVPVAVELVSEWADWSEPVCIRIRPRGEDDPYLADIECRRVVR